MEDLSEFLRETDCIDFSNPLIVQKFYQLYPSYISEGSVHGTVIYSGENYPIYKDFAYINFRSVSELFAPKTQPFVLNF